MKQKIAVLLAVMAMLNSLAAQNGAPAGFSYQAVLRKTDGSAFVPGVILPVRFQIRENSANGPVRFAETHSLVINQQGAIAATIGAGNAVAGQPHEMAAIDWGGADR